MISRLFLIPAVAFAAAVILSDCSSPEAPPVKEPDKLRPSLIYNIDSVRSFVEEKKGVDSTAAQQLAMSKELLPATPEKALYHIRNSISAKPTQKAYMELAAILSETRQFTEARSAYKVLTEIFPGFDRKLYLEMLYVSLLDPADGSLFPFYDLALKEGVKKEEIRSFLLGDNRLESFRKSNKFPILLEYFPGPKDNDEKFSKYRFREEFEGIISWTMIKSDYQERSRLPMKIGLKELASFTPEENARIWGYREFIPEYQEHHDYIGFMPVLRIYIPSEDDLEAMLYAIDTSAYNARPEMKTIFYRLVTMSYKDEVISSRIIARQAGEDVSTVSIISPKEGSYIFEVQHYKRKFKKPFNHKDNDNEVLETTPVEKEIITINEKGKIVSGKKKK